MVETVTIATLISQSPIILTRGMHIHTRQSLLASSIGMHIHTRQSITTRVINRHILDIEQCVDAP